MIKTFSDKKAARFFGGERVKQFEAFEARARRRLQVLDKAESIHELMGFPSNHFEALVGDRQGQFSIRINQRWRICFRFEDGDAYDVEITDHYR